MYPTAVAARRSYVDAPTGQVHVYDTGGEGTPLLLFHQSPTSSIDFFGVFPALQAAGLRLIAIDAPGMGLSDAPDRPSHMDDFVDAAFAVMDALKIERADAVGHHTGAQIAIEAAAKAPSRFGKLILYGIALTTDAERQAFWDMIVPREREGAMHIPVAGGQNLKDRYARLEELFGPKTAQHMLMSNLMAGPKMWYAHNAALTSDVAPAYAAVDHPILLITHPGEMLDAQSRAAHALKPGSTLKVLDFGQGVAMDSAPEAFAAAIVEFLRAERGTPQ